MWRLNSYWRIEEKDGGVYVQNESITLTRTVPVLLAWIANPLIKSLPRDVLAHMLNDTQDAVLKKSKLPWRLRRGQNRSKENGMKRNKTAQTETTRRAFISKSGLLLAGTVLASSSAVEAKANSASPMPAIPDPQQDIATLREDLATANHIFMTRA